MNTEIEKLCKSLHVDVLYDPFYDELEFVFQNDRCRMPHDTPLKAIQDRLTMLIFKSNAKALTNYVSKEIKDGLSRQNYSQNPSSPTPSQPGGPGGVIEGRVASRENGEGVHAFKSTHELSNYINGVAVPSATIYGTVALWGDIVEHELGYRAQFARVLSIDHAMHPDCEAKLPALRARYAQ